MMNSTQDQGQQEQEDSTTLASPNAPSDNVPVAHQQQQEPAEDEDDSNDDILSFAFNQDGGCLAIGTRRGFRICNVSPFQETFRRTFSSSATQESMGGGIAIVEMLFRCNLLALVGGGPSPKYPPNKVIMWDDYRAKPIGELSFRQRVLAVKLRRDRIAVVLTNRVYVYNFADLTLIDQIPTCTNLRGLVCMSSDASSPTVIATPGMTKGHLRIEIYSRDNSSLTAHTPSSNNLTSQNQNGSINNQNFQRTVLIEAHETNLVAMALSMDGTMIATASEKGTIVRVFDTRKGGAPLQEFRRGVERATIFCIAFSRHKDFIGVTSDRGTVHVFQMKQHHPHLTSTFGRIPTPSEIDYQTNNSSPSKELHNKPTYAFASLSKLTRAFALGESDPSYAQVRHMEDAVLCSFVPDATHLLAVVSRDGSLLVADFSNGGDAERISYHKFFKKEVSTSCLHRNSSHMQHPDNYTTAEVYFSDEAGEGCNQGVIFGEDEQEDGFIAVDQRNK
jgi:WD40 repeat protein